MLIFLTLTRYKSYLSRIAKLVSPVTHDEIYYAMDWLAQHIKNTDFGYKGHLKHEVPEPYIWDASFATDVSIVNETFIYNEIMHLPVLPS